jgi:hypothetical protein
MTCIGGRIYSIFAVVREVGEHLRLAANDRTLFFVGTICSEVDPEVKDVAVTWVTNRLCTAISVESMPNLLHRRSEVSVFQILFWRIIQS